MPSRENRRGSRLCRSRRQVEDAVCRSPQEQVAGTPVCRSPQNGTEPARRSPRAQVADTRGRSTATARRVPLILRLACYVRRPLACLLLADGHKGGRGLFAFLFVRCHERESSCFRLRR